MIIKGLMKYLQTKHPMIYCTVKWFGIVTFNGLIVLYKLHNVSVYPLSKDKNE